MDHEDVTVETPSRRWSVKSIAAMVSLVALLGLGAISCRIGHADFAGSEEGDSPGQDTSRRLRKSFEEGDSPGQNTSRILRESFEEGGFLTNAEEIKTFVWAKPTRTTLEAFNAAFPNGKGFWNVQFKEGKSSKPITGQGVVSWIDEELFKGKNPFAEYHGKVPIPWDVGSAKSANSDQLGPGQYVGYSRRQLCYIVAQSLVGADTTGYRNGLHRFMFKWSNGGCQAQTGGFGKSWWGFLAACSDDPTLKDGRQGPMIMVAKAHPSPDVQMLKELSDHFPLADSGFRLCRYDDGAIDDQDYLPGVPRTPPSMCKQPTPGGPGIDFMSTSAVKGQALQDIASNWLGGYVFGTECDLGGGQDTRALVYMPEVSALVFFLSQATATPQLRQPAWVIGGRMLFAGLDGTGQFDNRFVLDEWARMTDDLVKVQVKSRRFKVSTSKPLVGFESETHGMVGVDAPKWKMAKARTNQLPDQRDGSPTGKFAFRKQIAQWYRSVALESYSEDLHPMMKKVVKAVGAGPWMAGLWFGDSQAGVLAMWIGQALAVQSWGGSGALPLDYYLYSRFTENPSNQCFVHGRKACQKCLWACNQHKPAPHAGWLPPNALMSNDQSNTCVIGGDNACGENGLENVMWNFGMKHAGDIWEAVENIMQWHRGDVSHTIFDLLTQQLKYDRMAGVKPPSM